MSQDTKIIFTFQLIHNMRKLIIVVMFLFAFYFKSNAQEKLQNTDRVNYPEVINNLDSFYSYQCKNHFFKLYLFDNGSGSAEQRESDEVSYSILILKFPYGEHEKPETFMIRNLKNPKLLKVTEEKISVLEKTENKKRDFLF